MADVKNILQRSLSPMTWSKEGKVWNEYESFARSILEIRQRCPSYHFKQFYFFHHCIRRALRPAQLGLPGRPFLSCTSFSGCQTRWALFWSPSFFRDFQIQLSPTTSGCRLQGLYCTECSVPSPSWVSAYTKPLF